MKERMEKKLNGILLNFHHFLTPCLLIIWSVKKSIDIFTPNTFFHSWQLILTDTLVYLVPRKKIWKKLFSLFENTFVLSILRFRALSLPLFSQFPLVHRSFISFHSFIYIVLSLYTNLYAIKWMFVYAIFVRSLHIQSLNCNKKTFFSSQTSNFFFHGKRETYSQKQFVCSFNFVSFHLKQNKSLQFFIFFWFCEKGKHTNRAKKWQTISPSSHTKDETKNKAHTFYHAIFDFVFPLFCAFRSSMFLIFRFLTFFFLSAMEILRKKY